MGLVSVIIDIEMLTAGEFMEIFWTLVIVAALVWVLKKINDSEKAKRQIICPNPHCGFRGEGRVEGSSSGCLILVLLCFGVLPGILYLLFCGQHNSVICPRCGMRIR